MVEPTLFDMLFSSAWGVFWVLLLFNGAIVVHEYGHYIAARWRGLKTCTLGGPSLITGRVGLPSIPAARAIGAYNGAANSAAMPASALLRLIISRSPLVTPGLPF